MCYESKDCVLSKYHFVTSGGDIPEFQFQIFLHYQQKDMLYSKSKFSPTISFILPQVTGHVLSQVCAKRRLN